MANEKNLTPFTSDQSHDEAVKNGKKGGVASGAARRRKKTMRQTLNALLSTGLDVSEQEFVEKVTPRLLALGINVEDATYQDVMLAGILLKAVRERKGHICITSDSHSADTIVYAFPQAAEAARSCGFQEAWILTGKGWKAVDLASYLP